MKPIETGVGAAGAADAIALRAAAGLDAPLEDVCPQRFALPPAPIAAPRAERRSVDLSAVDAPPARPPARREFLVMEGAGGLLVPATEQLSMADLAQRYALPLWIVARAALGTINHTRLTLEAARARGLHVAGVVINHAGGPLPDAELRNLALLREELGQLLVGEIPPLPPD